MKISISTIQPCRRKTKKRSPYRVSPSTNTIYTRKQTTPNTNLDDVKMTSNDPKLISNEPVKPRKNELKGGANVEINGEILDEIRHKINF